LFALILALAGCATDSAARSLAAVQMDPKRTVEVIDVVDGSALGLAADVDRLVRTSDADIWVLLNSPGGMTIPGFTLADSLSQARAKGVRVRCVVGVLAASMAFDLLAYCDDRYVLPHAKLLFHPVRVSSQSGLTSRDIAALREHMARTEARMQADLLRMMGCTGTECRRWFEKHYWAETMWEAGVLIDAVRAAGGHADWLQLVDDVRGTDKLYTIQRPGMGGFGRQSAPAAAPRPVFVHTEGH
jgi:ATP-dependent protease ClpP protease subunit